MTDRERVARLLSMPSACELLILFSTEQSHGRRHQMVAQAKATIEERSRRVQKARKSR